MRILMSSAILLSSISCSDANKAEQDTDCSATTDSDNDGLNDCEEVELGTDPQNSDSDNDGISDADEISCVSDPLNAEEMCYTCGWQHNDPGTLTSTGSQLNDVIANIQMVDQCGDMVDLWDFHGEYHVIYMTAAW